MQRVHLIKNGILVLLITCFTALLLSGCGGNENGGTEDPPAVTFKDKCNQIHEEYIKCMEEVFNSKIKDNFSNLVSVTAAYETCRPVYKSGLLKAFELLPEEAKTNASIEEIDEKLNRLDAKVVSKCDSKEASEKTLCLFKVHNTFLKENICKAPSPLS